MLLKNKPVRFAGELGQVHQEKASPSSERRDDLRRVLLLIETSGAYGRGLLQGIARYNRQHGGWSICIRPRGMSDPSLTAMKLAEGQVDGVLVRMDDPRVLQLVKKSGAAMVNLRATFSAQPFPYVTVDHSQVAQLAAQHLQEKGLEHFAFCGQPTGSNPAFDQRGESFRREIEKSGGICHWFHADHVSQEMDWEKELIRLESWIEGLPKPVGIMACNDERGLQVLEACRRCGARVPDDVAVIGVDDDESLCELAIPPMSSIDVNAEGVGYEAAALLDRMMSGQKPATGSVLIAPRGVITRRSTDVAASEDEEIGQAVQYIRERACQKLQVADVLAHMGMSRASLQQRMKQMVGRTIHQEIQRVRFARVKELLVMSRLTIKQVAKESGFASVQYMTRVFRAASGETPALYRKRRT